MLNLARILTGFITPFILVVLTPLGITGETTIENAIEILVIFGLTVIAMYLTPKRK